MGAKPHLNGGTGGKAPQFKLLSLLYSLCSPPKTPHSLRVPLGCFIISVTGSPHPKTTVSHHVPLDFIYSDMYAF